MMKRIDWCHILLGYYCARTYTNEELMAIFSRANPDHLIAAGVSLEQKGFIEPIQGGGYRATETGKARYVIDSNCEGW